MMDRPGFIPDNEMPPDVATGIRALAAVCLLGIFFALGFGLLIGYIIWGV